MLNNDENNHDESVGEPNPAYHTGMNNRIRFFSTVKEQENEMIQYWASISPIERLKHLHEMIIASFGLSPKELQKPNLNSKITFIRKS